MMSVQSTAMIGPLRFNQALCLLRNGQFQAGLDAMEFRWGLGDTLQFTRYLRVIHQRGGRAQIAVQPELTTLFQLCPMVETVHT